MRFLTWNKLVSMCSKLPCPGPSNALKYKASRELCPLDPNQCPFLQICDLFKITFCDTTWATVKLESWNLANVCRIKYKKITGSRILIFLFLSFSSRFLFVFLLKNQKKFNKIEKSQKFKIPLPVNFLYFFSAYTCQISGL